MLKSIFYLFNNKVKFEILFLFFLNCLTALMEVISIGAIPVLLMYMLNPADLATKIPFKNLQLHFENLQNSAENLDSLKYILIGLFLLFLLKNLLTLFNSIYQAFFNRKISTMLSSSLFNNYLSENYLFFVNNKPSELIKNVESVGLVRSLITMILGSIKEILTILGIIVMIGISDYKIALLMISLGIIFMIFHKYKISNVLISYGKKSYIFTENRLSLINEFFGSIIDIKITNKENFFSKLFRNYIWSYETTRIVDKLITAAIRPVIEMIAITTMISIIILFTSEGKTFSEIIPLIALLSLSFIRILPSTILLINFTNRIKFESSQLKYLFKNITLKNTENYQEVERKIVNFKNKLEIKNLSFSYSKNSEYNLSNINLTINKGDNIGIIGKTGSGKSTLINNISNLIKFNEGKIIFEDDVIINPNENFIIKNLNYIRQNIHLLNDTIAKNISFGEEPNNVDKEFIKECLITVGLDKYKDKSDIIIGNRGSKISGGENQLLGLARALYKKPDLLFLDEPTSNLDYHNEKNYFDTIKKLNITTLVIAHRVQTLDYCNKIILMKDGKILDQGVLKYFKEKYENFTNYID